MRIENIAGFYSALIHGPYAWPGGYPLYFVMADGEAMSFKACRAECKRILDGMANGDREWTPVALEINYEDGSLYCCHSNERIESAYAEPEEESNDGEG